MTRAQREPANSEASIDQLVTRQSPRGASNNLFAPLSVQEPMARNVADAALFLDTMVGLCG